MLAFAKLRTDDLIERVVTTDVFARSKGLVTAGEKCRSVQATGFSKDFLILMHQIRELMDPSRIDRRGVFDFKCGG